LSTKVIISGSSLIDLEKVFVVPLYQLAKA